MAEKAPLLMLSLALRRQRRQREQDAEEQRQLEMKNAQQQQMQQQQQQSIARSPRPSIRRLSSSPLLPVIHEASSDDSDSHYSINTPSRGGDALASSGHCNNPSSGSSSSSSTPSFNSMSRHINWPPEDATWPPNNDNNGEHQGIIESTISYGSFHHHPSHHNEQQQDFEVHPDYISSSPSDSSDESNDGQSHYSITRRKRKNPNHLLRSRKHRYTTILVAAFAVCLSAVVWYPLLREPESHLPSIRSASIDDDDDDGQVPYNDRPSYPPWGYFKLRGKNKNSPEKALVDDEDSDDDVAPSWYRHRHSILNVNYSMYSEIVVEDSAKQSNITTPTVIGGDNTTPSLTISSDILFADLAAMLLPPYFQQTVNLCMSTLIESNQTNNTNFNPRTSVMPNEVYILRKTILKTRDLFDVFSPVYSKHSSLDDYDATQEEHDVSSKTRKHVSWGNGVTSFELTLQSDTMEHDTSKKKKATRKNKKKRNKKETKEKKREKVQEKEQVKEETTRFHDLWSILRRYLDRGYVLIGEFQDLDHAKIKYTSEQLAEYQHLIWKWNEDFLSFVKVYRHHISLYLSLPCKKPQLHHTSSRYVQCRHVHTHSSHLFWGNVTSKEELPDGNLDTATTVLGRLGSSQLGRAEMYLRKALTYDRVLSIPTVNETSTTSTSSSSSDSTDEEDGDGNVHEIYHNLRKELRSFVDELDLFGNLLLPNSTLIPEIVRNNSTASDGASSSSYIEQRPPQQEQTDQALYAVKRTRKTLGDLNDDYVKYMKYLEWDEYPQERQRIQTIIEAQWGYFRVWAREVDLFALIQHLRNIMEPQDSGDVMKNRE